jgi:hypothetical protein
MDLSNRDCMPFVSRVYEVLDSTGSGFDGDAGVSEDLLPQGHMIECVLDR